MTVRAIQWPQERAAVLAHLELAYDPAEFDELAVSYGDTVGFDPAGCFVIEGDYGEIAAHGMVMPRQIQVGRSILPVAEVGAITVLVSYSDLGYEALLLEALHDYIARSEDALSLTFVLSPGFARWDYEAAAGLYLSSYEPDITPAQALLAGRWTAATDYDRRTADRLGVGGRTVEVRRFYSDDLPAVMALYTAASVRGHYLLVRDEAAWRWQLDHLARIGRNEPDDFLVAEVDGTLMAYARLASSRGVNLFMPERSAPFSVIEAAGTHPDAVAALLAEVGRTAQTFGADRIGLYLHPESTLMQHALMYGASVRHFTGAAFMRLNNLATVLYQLQPELDWRRAYSAFAGRSYRLIVATEAGWSDVVLGTGKPEEVELEIPATVFARLITGWYGAEQLWAGYHERYAELLGVLFPRRDPKIGMADIL